MAFLLKARKQKVYARLAKSNKVKDYQEKKKSQLGMTISNVSMIPMTRTCLIKEPRNIIKHTPRSTTEIFETTMSSSYIISSTYPHSKNKDAYRKLKWQDCKTYRDDSICNLQLAQLSCSNFQLFSSLQKNVSFNSL